jgi:hypothetical protein
MLILLAGVQAFFEADAFVLEEVPHRVIADLDPALGRFRKQRAQCHVRLFGKPLEQPVAFGRQHIGTIAAHLPRRRASGLAKPPLPRRQRARVNQENRLVPSDAGLHPSQHLGSEPR